MYIKKKIKNEANSLKNDHSNLILTIITQKMFRKDEGEWLKKSIFNGDTLILSFLISLKEVTCNTRGNNTCS